MSRFPRLRRRPDSWSDAHERARTRLAERMDGPLGLAESTWLDEHLATCAVCTGVANAYEDERLALRALRDQPVEPPRDLWARTATGIEAAGGYPASRRSGSSRRLPIGVLSGLTVVAVVVGVSLLSSSLTIGPSTPVASPDVLGAGGSHAPAASIGVEATPFAVGAGEVAWLDAGSNGRVSRVQVSEVCPAKGAAGCPAVSDPNQATVAFDRKPHAVIGSPSRHQAVAIARSDSGDEVLLVVLPEPGKQPPASKPPAASEAPTATEVPTDLPSPTAHATSSTASAEPSSTPTDATATAPAPSVEPSAEASASPLPSAEATAKNIVSIANDIEVVGESAAFSPDGTWFAFTARPADGSGGPNVYAWHVGDEKAKSLTDDGASYFASWVGDELIASRPDDPDKDDAKPVTVRIDPATGSEKDAGDLWRPAIDPRGRLAIAWDGSLARADGSQGWAPDKGTLELRKWSRDGAQPASGPERFRVAADRAASDYDVRWDESGEWVAVWVADAQDPGIGRLTLYHVDTDRTRLEKVDGAPDDVPALPGFSIGDGRIAWATPRGQGGEGSRIKIAAWTPSGVGTVESAPGEDPVVIR
jgi:Putative zinc-finger/WD40-like Beta Propeller Repeat